ncbi:hypothetical protein [Streptomyces sp. NPDC002324]
MTTPPVPAWPRYQLTAQADGTVTVTGPAAPAQPYAGRGEAVTAVAAIAARLAPPRAVLADAVDDDGTTWPLLIDPDGTVHEAGPAVPAKKAKARRLRRNGERVTVAPWSRRRAEKSAAPAPETAAAPTADPAQPAVPLPQPPATPFVVPTVTEPEDDRTVRVRGSRTAPEDDDSTVRVRTARRAAHVAEQHERPAEEAPARQPAPSVITQPTLLPGPAAPQDPRISMQPQIPSYLRVRALEQAGRLDEALRMAAALDEAAARQHGPSHQAALQAREVLAHLTAQSGDLPAACSLYRDVAERWALQNQAAAADEAAGRAHALWLMIGDVDQAITTGETIVRMRGNIPGPQGRAYDKAVRRLAQLRNSTAPPPAAR